MSHNVSFTGRPCEDGETGMIDEQAREHQGSPAATELRKKHGTDLPSKSSVLLIP